MFFLCFFFWDFSLTFVKIGFSLFFVFCFHFFTTMICILNLFCSPCFCVVWFFFLLFLFWICNLKRYQILHSHNLHQNCTAFVCSCIFFLYVCLGEYRFRNLLLTCPLSLGFSRSVLYFFLFILKEKIML